MQERIAYLLDRRLRQELTKAESEELLGILQEPAHDETVTDVMGTLAMQEAQGPALDSEWVKVRAAAILEMDRAGKVRRMGWWKYAAAAAVILAIGGGIYYNQKAEPVSAALPDATTAPDLPPGGNVAILTLSDGRAIALDSAANGSLAKQGNTDIIKLKSGQLAYKGAGAQGGKTLYNTISTPRGGQYQLTLPDGSQVWLNAASHIRFPTAFSGTTRVVEITGEAYLEIAQQAKMPFIVKANGMAVEVLGTAFNVNAYTDEPATRATLVSGSVRIRKGAVTAMLEPGQQASTTDKDNITVNKEADMEGALAWKNGFFRMTSSDVSAIMRQLARWYDVDVQFEGPQPAGHITGEVPRNTSLSKVLKVLETSGVHFRITGRTIVVTQ